MRIWTTVAASVAALLLVPTVDAQRLQVSTQIVRVLVTVTDSNRRLVSDLEQADFEVYDNGKLQTIVNFENVVQPITVIVMLDTSGSMTLNLELLKQAAEQFVIRSSVESWMMTMEPTESESLGLSFVQWISPSRI